MSDDLNVDMSNLKGTLESIDKVVKSMTASMKEFGSALQSANKSGTSNNFSGFGSIGLGKSGGNIMGNSFGNVPQMLKMNRNMNMWGGIAQGGIQALTSAVGGAFGAMPDVGMTTARSAAFYDSAVMSGVSRNSVATFTMNRMRGGMTQVGGDAVVSGILSKQGIQYGLGGPNAGQYGSLVSQVSNAAKYLNIDNAQAAQSLSNLTSGSTSSNLMRKFGIWTTDPTSGKTLNSTQIFSALNDRILGGKKLTRSQLAYSMAGGALHENLSAAFGGDQTQMDLAYQYMLSRASDSKGEMDLTSSKSMAKYTGKSGDNPMGAIYSANSSQTATMQAASDSYIDGMKKAAVVIEKFNKAMQNFLGTQAGKTMAGLNAGVNLAMGDNTVGGLMGGAAGVFGGLMNIGGAIGQNYLLGKTLSKLGLGTGKGAAGGAAGARPKGAVWKAGGKGGGGRWVNAKTGKPISGPKGGGAKGGFKAGKIAGKLGMGMALVGGGIDLYNDVQNGQGWGTKQFNSDLGSTAGGMIGSALGALVPVPGLDIVTSLAGGWLGSQIGGWIGGQFGSGGVSGSVNTGSTTDTSGGIKLIHPVGRAKVTTKYGQTDKVHNNPHKGIDFAVGIGTSVMAAAAGTVKGTGGSSANTMGTSNHSYGIWLEIDHGGGYTTLYGHLSSVGVSKGQQVTQGQVVALSGNSGYSTGPHLHFELRKDGVQIDPSAALGGNYSSGGASSFSDSQSTASSMEGGVAAAELLGFSNAGISKASGYSIPPSYRGAQTSASVSAPNGSTIGHGATSTNTGGSIGSGQGSGPDTSAPAVHSTSGNNVTINLTIANASEAEARVFAKRVKQYLEEDRLTSNMGVL